MSEQQQSAATERILAAGRRWSATRAAIDACLKDRRPADAFVIRLLDAQREHGLATRGFEIALQVSIEEIVHGAKPPDELPPTSTDT